MGFSGGKLTRANTSASPSCQEPAHIPFPATTPFLPANKPRYTMGLGTPPQLLKMIALGVDMFDCMHPTRVARNGAAFTPDGLINLRNERHRADPQPLVEGLDNYTCRNFSRAYLRHLVMANEILACTLISLHNVHFYLDLVAQARAQHRGRRLRPVAPRLDRAIRGRGADGVTGPSGGDDAAGPGNRGNPA